MNFHKLISLWKPFETDFHKTPMEKELNFRSLLSLPLLLIETFAVCQSHEFWLFRRSSRNGEPFYLKRKIYIRNLWNQWTTRTYQKYVNISNSTHSEYDENYGSPWKMEFAIANKTKVSIKFQASAKWIITTSNRDTDEKAKARVGQMISNEIRL